MTLALLIDDEPEILRSLKRLFLRRGFDVQATTSWAEALEIAQDVVPDVIVSDFKMPKMKGTELLMTLGQRCPHARRVLLTGYIDFSQEVLPEGVRMFAKPWNEAELVGYCGGVNDVEP